MIFKRRFLSFAAACALAALTTCAPPPPPPPPPPAAQQMPPAIPAYGEAMIQTIKVDGLLKTILVSHGITHGFAVGLVVDPNGYVEKGFILKSALPPDASVAIIQHLINVNFGNFLPGMPNHQLIFVVPVAAPAT